MTSAIKEKGAAISDRLTEVHAPSSDVVRFPETAPLKLACRLELKPFSIAYKTYGTLNAGKIQRHPDLPRADRRPARRQHPPRHRQARLVGHAWSGRASPSTPTAFYVICANILGGCMGSTGPASTNPATNAPYGLDFPVITIGDMVEAQARLIDHLGIADLFAVIGGSMGGMQVLEWAARYKDRVFAAVPIATAAWHSSQNIAFHEVGRQAVMADPDWCRGNYYAEGKIPRNGLAVARMAAHITYLSEEALHQKFGRSLQDRSEVTFSFNADFQVESYLRHQGSSFVDRFDPNSYLYITRAMDYFDMKVEHGGQLAEAFRGTKTRFCVVSFTSDWLYPTRESRAIVHALNAVAANVSFVEIESDKGHDAFLLEEPVFHRQRCAASSMPRPSNAG